MYKIAATLFICLFAASAQASGEQDHTCQGGHNCNDGTGTVTNTNANFNGNVNFNKSKSTSTASASVLNNVPVTVNVAAPEGSGFTPQAIDGDVEVNTVINGDNAPDFSKAVGTPATVFTDACGSGVAGGFPGGSASLGEGNEVCLWLAVARTAQEQGNVNVAEFALAKAADELDDQNDTIWKRWSQVPYVGWLAPRRWLPFFGKNF